MRASTSRRSKRARTSTTFEETNLPSPAGVHEKRCPESFSGTSANHQLSSSGFLVAPGLVLAQQRTNLSSSSTPAHEKIDETAVTTSLHAAFPVCSDGIVRLNVGGELFVVHRDTLLGHRSRHPEDRSDDSFFYRLLHPDAGSVPCVVDPTGSILIDRDPFSFSIILNYLRGYQNALDLHSSIISMVAQDAEYYQLEGLQRCLAKPTTNACPLLFCPGPGIAPERRRFKPTFAINFIGDRFYLRGRHRIRFEVVASEYLGIGVASDACVAQDMEFHRTTNCCVYYMSGVFYSAFPSPRKEEAVETFGATDEVEMLLDMDARLLTYSFRGVVVKVVSVKSAYRLRFAVTIKKKTAIRIIEFHSED